MRKFPKVKMPCKPLAIYAISLVSVIFGTSVLLAGCGSVSVKGDATMIPAGVVAVGDTALVSLDAKINGTVAQRRNSRFLDYVKYQDSFKSCFTEAGQVYRVAPFTDILVGVSEPQLVAASPAAEPASTESARQVGFHVAERAKLVWKSERAVATPVEHSDSWGQTMGSCSIKLNVAEIPKENSLSESFSKAVVDLSRTSGAEELLNSTYPSCMADAGYKVDSRQALEDSVREKFTPFSAPGGPPVGGAAWTSATTYETSAAVADATCRQPAHALFAQGASKLVAEFTKAHLSEVSASATSWAAVSSRAQEVRKSFFTDNPEIDPLF